MPHTPILHNSCCNGKRYQEHYCTSCTLSRLLHWRDIKVGNVPSIPPPLHAPYDYTMFNRVGNSIYSTVYIVQFLYYVCCCYLIWLSILQRSLLLNFSFFYMWYYFQNIYAHLRNIFSSMPLAFYTLIFILIYCLKCLNIL